MSKMKLWRGLSGVLAVLFTLSLGLTVIAGANATTINTRILGTSNNYEIVQLEGDDVDSYYFKSEFASVADLVAAKVAVARQISAEGSVLLKNNGALPLNKTGDKVTLWGLNTTVPQLGGQIGSSVSVGEGTTQVIYDYVTAMKEAGFNLNQTMLDFYNSEEMSAFKRRDGFGGSMANSFGPIYENPNTYGVGEAPASAYTDAVLSSADGTVGIAIITRSNSEAADYHPGMQPQEVPGSEQDSFACGPLGLSEFEKQMLALAKAHSSKLIVLINANSAMMVEELKDETSQYAADAILWIGAPGMNGFLGVADVLCGEANPSGGLPDTMAVDNRMSPAMQNFGVYMYSNNSVNGKASGDVAQLTPENKSDWYLAENEGIYVGYKYYETRYADAVNGRGNADSQAGSSIKGQNWAYGSEVSYPFGYGLSYTEFSFVLNSVSFQPGSMGSATVTVKNEGDVAGKTPVQLYVQVPYTEGGLEKSAIQLAAFGKTDILKPGESVKVDLEVDPSLFASYDENEGDGAWVLDAGEYYFAVGNGAHAALNNILSAQGVDESKLVKTADEVISSQAAKSVNLGKRDTESYSHNVHNALQDMELETYGFDMDEYYFTRSDWTKGWKTMDSLTPTPEMMKGLTNQLYTLNENDNDGNPVRWGQNNGLTLANMLVIEDGKKVGVLDMDDPKWIELAEQMKLEDAMTYLANWDADENRIQPAVGMGVDMVKQDGPLGTSYDQLPGYGVKWGESNKNEATYVPADSEFAAYSMSSMPTEPVVAATFNEDLVRREGELFGEDGLWANLHAYHAPGLNLHRVPYNGRNHEYYSEDPVLTNILGKAMCEGSKEKGTMMGPKHYAFNHQESNRSGVSTFISEQAARENELRCFQGAYQSNAAQGMMTAFNRAGPSFSGAHEGLILQILRSEWGYTGWIITDMVNGSDYMNWRDTIANGGGGLVSKTAYQDSTIGDPVTPANMALIEKDQAFQADVQETVKYFLYNLADSNYMNYLTANTTFRYITPWWQSALTVVNVVLGVLTLGGCVMYVTSAKKNKGGA